MMDIQQQFVAITIDDGSVAIMGFLTQGRGSALPDGATWLEGGWWSRKPTDANINSEIDRSSFGEGRLPLSWQRINRTDIPADRTFRDALKDDGLALGFDMPKARELHRRTLRNLRVAEFEENDIILRDALLAEDKAAQVVAIARRDALRDVTEDPAIEAAKNTDELKLAGMAILEG